MSIVLQQNTVSDIAPVTSTVQSIINRVAQDLRFQLASTGQDATILIDYADRRHKEILRRTHWASLLSPVQAFTTVAGFADYYIGPQVVEPQGTKHANLLIDDMQSFKRGSMVDVTNKAPLFPTAETPLSRLFETPGRPKLFRLDPVTPDILTLYPTPDQAYTIEFRYFVKRVTLADASDHLQIDPDYDDILIAGINSYGYQFIKNDPERSAFWEKQFQVSLFQMIKDQQNFPRGPEFILPDAATQVRPGSFQP